MKHREVQEIHSKFRQYIWDQMKKLFDFHMNGRKLLINETEMRQLISMMVKNFNLADIDYLLDYLGMM